MTENYEEAPEWAKELMKQINELKEKMTPEEDRFADFKERLKTRLAGNDPKNL